MIIYFACFFFLFFFLLIFSIYLFIIFLINGYEVVLKIKKFLHQINNPKKIHLEKNDFS